MKNIRNNFLINNNCDDSLELVIVEYSTIDEEYDRTVGVCRLNSFDDIFYVIKRIVEISNIEEYETILSILPYLREYDDIEKEINNMC